MSSLRSGPAIVAGTTVTMLLSVTACGSDSPSGISGDPLDAAETAQLVYQFFDVLDLIDIPLLDTAIPAAGARPAATPYGELYDDQIDGATECAGGGSASVTGLITGDVDEAAETADIAVAATADFAGCVVPGETTTFTLNGNPDVGLSADISITPTSVSIDISVDGDVAFATNDGRSGSCTLDFGVSGSATVNGGLETHTGTVCGLPVSQLDISLFD